MKNIVLKSLVASSLLCSSLFAGNVFVGVNGGYSLSSKIKITPDGYDSINLKDKRSNLGFKVGYDFGEFKAYGAYIYKAKGSKFLNPETIKWGGSDFLVGGDYTPKIANNFKLDLGIYAGISKLRYELDNPDYSINSNKQGTIYGAKFGGIFEFNESNELEFGYQIDKTTYKDVKIVDEKFKIDITDHGLYLGYNYKF